MSDNRKHLLHILFLVVSTLVVYWPSIHHEFIPFLDDTAYIICNGSIRGFSFQNIKAVFSHCYVGNYAPVHMLSYMVDYHLSGLKPSCVILFNIFLHTCNGSLFYYLLVRSRFTANSAFAAALIFLLHPVQVESVVWASERKTVLSMLFFLLAVHCYLNYRSDAGAGAAKRARHYLFSLFLFVLAVLSKSVVVILPVFLLVHDLAYRNTDRCRQWLKDKAPYLLIAVAGAVITMYSQDASRMGGRTGFHGGSAVATFFTMLPVLSQYLRMVFCPTGLSFMYGDVLVKTSFDEDVFQAAVVAIALIALGIVLFRRNRELFCWYALFFVGLLPVSQIVPIVTLINDRYLYFPMLGGAACIAAAVTIVNRRFIPYKGVVPALSAAVFLVLCSLTFNQAKTWQSPVTVFKQAINNNHEVIFDSKFMESIYTASTDMDDLVDIAQTLASRYPDSPEVMKLAGTVYSRTDKSVLARQYLQKGVSLNPGDRDLMALLAANYSKAGDFGTGRRIYEAIAASDPASESAARGLASLGGAR